MDSSTIELEDSVETTQRPQQVLQLARSLDAIGRRTEEFLCEQLDQLERAIDEFESEKAAWRRQYRRESQELARQREAIERLTESHGGSSSVAGDSIAVTGRVKKVTAENDARLSGANPLRLLIQTGTATAAQVGLLMFEISKLNRDMGGRGLRFEIDDVRVPKRGLLKRITGSDAGEQIVELTVFSAVPLIGRGTHVNFDVDVTDRLEDWITFKSLLLQSSLVNTKLVQEFEHCQSVKDKQQSSSAVKDAVRIAMGNQTVLSKQSASNSSTMWANSYSDAIQQQIARLENCHGQLLLDSGLLVHIEPHQPLAETAEH